MDENLLIYELKDGDTLASVAGKMGATEFQLLDFHNEHCEKAGLLWINGISGIRKIVVPEKPIWKDDTKENKRKFFPEKFSSDFLLKTYKVSEKIKEQDSPETEISYDLNIEIQEEEVGFVASVSQTNFRNNGETVDDKIGSLALDCMKNIWPLEYHLSENGAISSLKNHADVLKKFRQKRGDIADFHIGEINEKYLDKFEEAISDESLFLDKMRSTLLYQILFSGMDFILGNRKNQEIVLYRNSFPVRIGFKTFYDFEADAFSEIRLEGRPEEDLTLLELLRGIRFNNEDDEPLSATMDFEFQIDKSSRQLNSVSAEIILNYEEDIFYRHYLNLES